MYKKSLILATFILCGMSSSALARDCNQSDAEARWKAGENAGIIAGFAMLDHIPTVAVDPATWDLMDLQTRLGLVDTLECLLAGPGKVLRVVHIIEPTGKMMAKYNGIGKKFDVIIR